MDSTVVRDEDLVEQLVRGDERALEPLYDRYGRPIYSLALRVLRDPHRAEEIAQEVFLTLWRRPTSFHPGRGSFATWLLSVTYHRAVDALRAQRRDNLATIDSNGTTLDIIDNGLSPEEFAWLRQQRSVVRLALTNLPARQRQAIELAYFGGLTQREIADRLGEPLGTVKTRTRLALQKLRVLLGDEVDPVENGARIGADLRHPLVSMLGQGAIHADV